MSLREKLAKLDPAVAGPLVGLKEKLAKLDPDVLAEKVAKAYKAIENSDEGASLKSKFRSIVAKQYIFSYVLPLCIFILVAIVAFFGYKLYKSLVERDRRREEKRRQKQQKKKK